MMNGDTDMDKLWQQNLPISGIKDIVPVSGGDVNDAYRIDRRMKIFLVSAAE